MTETLYQSPLQWPTGTPVTPVNSRGFNNGFKQDMALAEALAYLEEEIQEIAPQRATVYSDYQQLKTERLRKKVGSSNAISIELKINNEVFCLGCDRWHALEHNVYALHLALRNFRMMERWGIAPLARLMQGFAEPKNNHNHTVPHGGGHCADWMQILGLGPTATLEDAHAVYRRRAKLLASDADALMKLNTAMDEARKALA